MNYIDLAAKKQDPNKFSLLNFEVQGNEMSQYTKFENLTLRGMLFLHRLGNATPTLSQIQFTQEIVELLLRENQYREEFDNILKKYATQSQESIQKDTLHFRNYEAVERLECLSSRE